MSRLSRILRGSHKRFMRSSHTAMSNPPYRPRERLFRLFEGWSRIERMLHVRHPRLACIVEQFKTQAPRCVSLPSVSARFIPADRGCR